MAKTKRKLSGGAEINKRGHVLVWVTLTPEDRDHARLAAAACKVPMSEFCRQAIIDRSSTVVSRATAARLGKDAG